MTPHSWPESKKPAGNLVWIHINHEESIGGLNFIPRGRQHIDFEFTGHNFATIQKYPQNEKVKNENFTLRFS